ncbi:unnamed protein product [Trifolium pratense]|uniref:Uncharacterized protein n=1 Tax=Trifolium pratense TaxID=57577 RepID=A0ACB0JZ45_TRIPR|nr:unnamed protein product [Trifolium pratense]
MELFVMLWLWRMQNLIIKLLGKLIENLIQRVQGKSNPYDSSLAAQLCIPIINDLLVEIKNQSYHEQCFLNIDVPNNVTNHKVHVDVMQ